MRGKNRALAAALMRVIVYIDALNFYYGALRGWRWKWLDLEEWSAAIAPGGSQLAGVHYCTSLVQGGDADQSAANRQAVYLRALQARGFWDARRPLENRRLILPDALSDLAKAGDLQIHFGRHKTAPVFAQVPGLGRQRVKIVREKETDVNLAARMVADAALDRFDLAILVAGDSDYIGACRIVREEFGKEIHLHPPGWSLGGRGRVDRLVESVGGEDNVRPILPGTLAACQLPDIIPGTKIRRPLEW